MMVQSTEAQLLHVKEPYRTHFGQGMSVAQKQE